jgi:AcrR family transcriptional regulator
MSPRTYRLGERETASRQTRARIVEAARSMLAKSDSFTGLSIEAVARAADVARMTVYYQFGSKVGLLEALCDSLAANGGMEQLAGAFRMSDPYAALDELIRIFSQFWESDRLLARRLRGLATLDKEFEQVIRARDQRRRHGLRVLVGRLVEQAGLPAPEAVDDTVELLFTLTSFETFDMLAGPTRTCPEVAPTVQRLVRAALNPGA